MSQRSRVRQIVLQILFQEDLNSTDGFDWRKFLHDRLRGDPGLTGFGFQLLDGVRTRQGELDELIQAASINWRVGRMPPVDRNVLRLAAWEICFGVTPPRVAIDEAINLARRFGGQNSPQFVNGVLDRLLRDRTAAPEQQTAEVRGGPD
jgi:transcription antitermination protein NusB